MRVRLLFYCPRCESILFRPSLSHATGDSLRRAFGMYAHRCLVCRNRFYLFKPSLLLSLLTLPVREPQTAPATPAVVATPSTARANPGLSWNLLSTGASDGHAEFTRSRGTSA